MFLDLQQIIVTGIGTVDIIIHLLNRVRTQKVKGQLGRACLEAGRDIRSQQITWPASFFWFALLELQHTEVATYMYAWDRDGVTERYVAIGARVRDEVIRTAFMFWPS